MPSTKTILFFLLAVLSWPGFLSADASPQSHSTKGVVEDIEKGGKVLVISHEDFPGFMSAMTMPFEVADLKLSKGIKVGDHIRFTITQKGDFWPITAIKRLHVKKAEAKAVPAALPKPSPTMNMPM